jgi:hypothetical protein
MDCVLPLHSVCAHRQSRSGVLAIDSHSTLQYLPDVATHEQTGCAHFSAFAGPFLSFNFGSRAHDPSLNISHPGQSVSVRKGTHREGCRLYWRNRAERSHSTYFEEGTTARSSDIHRPPLDQSGPTEGPGAAFQGNLAARAASKRSNCKGPLGPPCAVTPHGTWPP